MMIKKYLVNILISIDQFFNTILGGDPDETISSRLGKCKEKGNRFCILTCKLLTKAFSRFGIETKEHCIEAIEVDEGSDAIKHKGK